MLTNSEVVSDITQSCPVSLSSFVKFFRFIERGWEDRVSSQRREICDIGVHSCTEAEIVALELIVIYSFEPSFTKEFDSSESSVSDSFFIIIEHCIDKFYRYSGLFREYFFKIFIVSIHILGSNLVQSLE